MDLLHALQTQVICGDGAMGTLLLDQGIRPARCLEELCLSDPDRIREIHEQYIAAGARVVETNTFGANAVRLERHGLETKMAEINCAAARLALEAARGKDVAVAGCVGPLGISADEARARGIDPARCFREQIAALLEGGVNLIILETFTAFGEMEIAFRAKKEVSDVLAICSFACSAEGRLADGIPLEVAFAKLRAEGAEILGLNCVNGLNAMVQLLERVPIDCPMVVYPNAGLPQYYEGRLTYPITPDYFGQAARAMVSRGARMIGGCCGTNPTHIRAMASALAELKAVLA